jgi:two-component system response regulator RpaA
MRTRSHFERQIFTTGQIAKLCGASTRTVCKWIDNGILKGRRIPGGLDRRVDRADLLRFLTDNEMPTDALIRPEPLAAQV